MEMFAGLVAGTNDDNFVKRSLSVGWGSDRWEKTFETFHPDFFARLSASKANYAKFIDHFYFSTYY